MDEELLQPGPLAQVVSESDPKKVYNIIVAENGTVYCTCRGWVVKSRQEGFPECKHMRKFFETHFSIFYAAMAAWRKTQNPIVVDQGPKVEF